LKSIFYLQEAIGDCNFAGSNLFEVKIEDASLLDAYNDLCFRIIEADKEITKRATIDKYNIAVVEEILEMPEDLKLIKDRIFKEISNDTDGLNIKRVEGYIQKVGLDKKDYIIIDKNQLPKLEKIIGGKIEDNPIGDNARSFYCGLLDLTVVFRDKEMENANGLIFTEGQIIHEVAHGDGHSDNYLIFKNGQGKKITFAPKTGLYDSSLQTFFKNEFLEEAWADWHRGDYIEKFADDDYKKLIARAIKKNNFEMDDEFFYLTHLGRSVPVPIKYLNIAPDKSVAFTPNAFAAYALELICNENKELYSFIKQARRSPEKIKEVLEIINEITGGYYLNLVSGNK